MNKFLLAYNPISPNGLFIVHCLPPLAIIEVSKSPPREQYLKLDAGNEVWYLSILSCDVSAEARLSMLKRAMYWYKEYRLQVQMKTEERKERFKKFLRPDRDY